MCIQTDPLGNKSVHRFYYFSGVVRVCVNMITQKGHVDCGLNYILSIWVHFVKPRIMSLVKVRDHSLTIF